LNRERGFTLLEVVVALALFSILMTLVYGALDTAVRAFEAGQERTGEASQRRVVSEFLARNIAAAAPIAVADGREWSLLFGGDAASLHWVAELPAHAGAGGLHELELAVEREGGGRALVMRWRALAFDAQGRPSGEFRRRVLAEDVEHLRLRYLGRDDDGGPLEWREEWSASRRLPLLVELALEPAARAGAEPWPALRVRPRVDTIRYQGVAAATASGRAEQPEPPAQSGAAPRPPDGAAPASALQ